MPSQLFAFDGRGTLLAKQRTFCPATKSVVGLFQKIYIYIFPPDFVYKEKSNRIFTAPNVCAIGLDNMKFVLRR